LPFIPEARPVIENPAPHFYDTGLLSRRLKDAPFQCISFTF
jgi:hypothetical protein